MRHGEQSWECCGGVAAVLVVVLDGFLSTKTAYVERKSGSVAAVLAVVLDILVRMKAAYVERGSNVLPYIYVYVSLLGD